jgi:hypothetical protein
MDHITQKHLESLVKYINEITKSPAEPYTKQSTGEFRSNVGNYHLDWAYSGVNLARMCNESGGISQPIGGGFFTKRELYEKLHAYIRGIETGKAIK